MHIRRSMPILVLVLVVTRLETREDDWTNGLKLLPRTLLKACEKVLPFGHKVERVNAKARKESLTFVIIVAFVFVTNAYCNELMINDSDDL